VETPIDRLAAGIIIARKNLSSKFAMGNSPVENKPMTTSMFRASAPRAKVTEELGPLAEFTGTWVGSGFNLISLPDKHENKPFRLKLNATHETLSFTLIGGPIPNRGSAQDDIEFLGVHYFQQVSDAATSAGLHLEPGLWLNMPITTNPPLPQPGVARLGTIPHGDALLAQGNSLTVNGGPRIDPVDSTPFTLDPTTGARLNNTNPAYLAPFGDAILPPGIPAGSIANPNLVLTNAIDGQNIVNTIVLFVSANPVGGINGTPIAPPNTPFEVGGIVNLPFVNANANANAFSAIFWIETVENSDGSQFLQLQYTQTVILDFIGLKWPHISVSTLVKQ
jgi:hypothetical protein